MAKNRKFKNEQSYRNTPPNILPSNFYPYPEEIWVILVKLRVHLT